MRIMVMSDGHFVANIAYVQNFTKAAAKMEHKNCCHKNRDKQST